MTSGKRQKFRQTCVDRDNSQCIVPWCNETVTSDPDGKGDVHHIIERKLWENGGYVEQNGVSICSKHHKDAEKKYIPPQAFWYWANINEPVLPDGLDRHVNKFGESLESPRWKDRRKYIKYHSTRHLPFSNIGDQDDTYLRTVDPFLDIPLVITEKMDGSNAMLIKDMEHPVRARNGSQANHKSFSMLKDIYWEIHEDMPSDIQIFGEWLYAKHSIHYGCNCIEECQDVGKSLSEYFENEYGNRVYFQIFGVYNMEFDFWYSWPETEKIADELGFPTVPVIDVSGNKDKPMYVNKNQFYEDVYEKAQEVIGNGGEGVVVRSKYPFHYGEFRKRVGKYVRKNHVKSEEHWSHKQILPNRI